MTMTTNAMKDQARRLRQDMARAGNPISHARSLELVARSHGHRDWNTAHATAGHNSQFPPVAVGQTIGGTYLGQAFRGVVLGLQTLSNGSRWRIVVQLEKPVDVVRFESFSALRSRITATIDRDGRTSEHTSDGQPHLVLDLGA